MLKSYEKRDKLIETVQLCNNYYVMMDIGEQVKSFIKKRFGIEMKEE